jgi:hypothetical protein
LEAGRKSDIDLNKFKIEREEFDFYEEYASSETPEILRQRTKEILYLPPHAPAFMGLTVRGDRLLLITGNRDRKREENEVLVYHLPAFQYEGSFSIPFPDLLQTKWYDDYYISRKLIKKDDDYYSSYEIYTVEEK